MLVLSRQRDESIMIGDDVEIIIVDVRGDKVRLGITAPKSIPVHRREIYDAIQREKNEKKESDKQPQKNGNNHNRIIRTVRSILLPHIFRSPNFHPFGIILIQEIRSGVSRIASRAVRRQNRNSWTGEVGFRLACSISLRTETYTKKLFRVGLESRADLSGSPPPI